MGIEAEASKYGEGSEDDSKPIVAATWSCTSCVSNRGLESENNNQVKKIFLFLWLVGSLNITNAQHSLMLYSNVNGLSIAYQKAGSGPAIVLLHGFTQDSRIWKTQIEILSKYFTVIAWDAPGAGLSADPPDSFNIHDWADCLAGLLDLAGIQQAHILGLSWGGLLAQEFYQHYSARVLSLILADTYAGWTGSLSDSVANARLANCIHDSELPPPEFVPKYLSGMFSDTPKPETKDALCKIMSDTHPKGFRLMATALAIADTRTLLSSIKVPTLLIWGELDKRSPISVSHQMQDAIHGAKLEIISGAGHVSNMERPEQFNDIVKEFCLSVTEKK
jgi:pimeloyl-ACP methyl ester carboxylesterase